MAKQKVVLAGAGGKMGIRLTNNLKDHPDYEVSYLEVSEVGIARMAERGVAPSPSEEVIPSADLVIMAVPDIFIKKIAHELAPQMKPGAMMICLDPAAPLAGALPPREDLAYFATHPSHPSVFNWEPVESDHFDYFGGIAARQTIVCALIQGKEEDYARGENLAKVIYGPVTKAFRITIEQMGILEPALSETFAAAMVTVLKEGLETAISKGVPAEAATEFFLGHINIELALLFGKLPGGQFSDAAKKAIEIGKPMLFKDDWKKIFDRDNVMQQIRAIT
ncbi:MAG: phosphogluconate dehydrogenase C-terminal domain-containing protein [Bacteroidia bacterium]|nr:phosphogluconate dehydrogenase C-terminal domain-containing protein [Bacteroidia bacterium]